jgi:hypothetical protein
MEMKIAGSAASRRRLNVRLTVSDTAICPDRWPASNEATVSVTMQLPMTNHVDFCALLGRA